MIRISYIVLLLFCSFFTTVHSQISISIPSITVEKNENFTLQVPISFEEGATIDSFSFIVKFNPQVITLLSATTPISSVITCDTLQKQQLYTPPDRMQVLLSCNNTFLGASNQLLLLHFQALAGKDSTTVVELENISQNGVNIPIVNPSNGLVTIRNNKQVVQNFPEYLGQNFPNPFFFESSFPYSINIQTPVTFTVYNAVGEMILTYPPILRERGEYVFLLKMDRWEFASGTYCLQMETNEGVYFQSFLYLK